MSAHQPSSDRNLLFGLLALKMDLISRAALLDGMSAWLDRKHDPLGLVLQERGALTGEDRDAIDRLLERHVARHGDPQSSLAAMHVEADLHRQLAQSTDDALRHSLSAVTPTPATGGGADLPEVAPGPAHGRYRRLRPHARGGLGEVHVALDEELRREVALKEILPQHADRAESRLRFVREAEITGGLEHPGVVPVYGLGSYPDGRPFYAMRFIRGESLHDAITRFHYADEDQRDPGERELALRSLLTRFVAVCNAVAYAHSRGVIHRDLKPANVMLGEYGETLVVDWGLAKVLDQPEERTTAERPIPVSSPGSAPTQMGLAVGTPSYMPPEQAQGHHDRAGPASDVFSLGATLYCLLTGRPPYTGTEALSLAAKAEPLPAREVNPRVPRALDAVCARAMAPAHEDRYASARLLAGDVERWLADEPVSVGREPLAQKARRWANRNRTLVSSGVVLLMATLVGLAAGLYAVGVQKAKTDEALAAAEVAKDEANQRRVDEERARKEATRKRLEAEANLARAVKAEKSARESLALSEMNFKLAKKAVDETFGLAKDHRLLKGPDLSPAMRELRKVLLEKALPFYKDLRFQRPDDPGVLYDAQRQHFRLAMIHGLLGQRKEALREYQEAEAALRRLIKTNNRPELRNDLANVLMNAATYFAELGQPRESENCLGEAIAIYRSLIKDRPDEPLYLYHLANTLGNQNRQHFLRGEVDPALKGSAEAISLYRALVQARPDDPAYREAMGLSLANRGFLLAWAREREEALKCLDEAVDTFRGLVKAHPTVSSYRSNLGFALFHRGTQQIGNKQLPLAAASLAEAAQAQRQLVTLHPDVITYQQRLAMTLDNLANVQDDLNKPDESLKTYAEAIDLGRRLARANPGLVVSSGGLVNALLNRAVVRYKVRQLPGARDDLAELIGLLEGLQKNDPARRPHPIMRLASLRRAVILDELKQHREAIKDWDRGIALTPEPGRPPLRAQLALSLAGAGEHERAADIVAQFARAGKLTSPQAYNFACVLALTGAAARRDVMLPLPTRERLGEQRDSTAVAMLDKLAKAGFFTIPARVTHLDKDPDLDSIRGREDYQRFRAALPPGQKPAPQP